MFCGQGTAYGRASGLLAVKPSSIAQLYPDVPKNISKQWSSRNYWHQGNNVDATHTATHTHPRERTCTILHHVSSPSDPWDLAGLSKPRSRTVDMRSSRERKTPTPPSRNIWTNSNFQSALSFGVPFQDRSSRPLESR